MKRKHHRKSFDWYGMKQRFSIRKYHFGAASVLIGTTLFLMGSPLIQAAEQSQNQTIVERDKTSNKELSNQSISSSIENSQKEKALSVEEDHLKEARKPIVSKEKLSELVQELRALLAEFSSDSSKIENQERVLQKANQLLESEDVTQEMINDQVALVQVAVNSLNKLKETNSSDNQVKNVSDKKEVEKNSDAKKVKKTENGKDVTNLDSENKPLAEISKDSNTEEVSTRSRGRKKAELKERTTEKEEQDLPVYENGSGSYKIAEEMRNIIDYMKKNGADTNEIAAIKANYDQLNMVLGAHEDGVLPEEEFKRAAANLTGARNKIEEFLNRNTNIPGTERTEVTLHNRQTREYGLNFQDSREYYYEDGKRGISPYSKYTYVFHNYRATNAPKFDHQPVSNAEKYIHVRVDPTDTGFLWTVSVNAGRFSNTTNDSYWFTIPKGQNYKQGSANVDVQNLQGTNSYQGDGSLEGAMRQAGLLQVNKGANLKGVFRYGKVGANAYKTDNFEALARENVDAPTDKGLYNRVLEQGEEQKLSNEKFKKITKTGGDLYYFEQPSNVFKYTITFETVGDASDPNRNDPDDLVYAAGFKGITRADKVYRVLVNQWHAQTDAETSNIDRYRMTLKNGGTFFVEQNKYYNRGWPDSDYLGIGKWYGTKNLNPDIKKVDGIITFGDQQNFTSIDFFSYINYKAQKGKDFERIKYEANHDHGQTFTFYREDGTPISQKDLGAEAGGSPGVHTYYYKRYFTSDGSSDSGKFRFIVKLKNPVLAPTTKYVGENHTFTASGSTKGSPVTLWREYIDESGHKQTQEVDTKVVENNSGTVTFKDITLEKGKYYVHSKIATDSYLDYNGKKHSTVESDPVTENQKNVIVEPPVVKINGHKLTTNANDNQFIIYKGANFNPTFQVENEGNQVNYLKVTNIPRGVWFNNVNGSDKEKVNMASGSTHTLADNTVENSARDGEASVTVRNHNNREVVYKFKYIIADVQPSNASRDKRVGDTLGDPHSYVKAVVNGGEGDQYFPSGMRFGWVTNRATLANENTVLDRPGNIGDYNAQVIFPNNRPVEKEIDHVNYTIYTPSPKTVPVRFNVTDSVAPTVKMTNPNNTDSTLGDSENGAPEVEVFRGATLNIPLKMYDNNVHGKINIKQISGLPAGVTLKDGNTVINNGNTLSKNSGSETNPATATITGTVAPNAILGTNVVTLKVSDDATGDVNKGNQATLKFKVKTYDLAFEEKGTPVNDNTRSDVLRLNENSVDPNHYLAITDGRNVTNNWGSGMVFRYLKENNEIRERVSFDKIGKHSVKARAYFPNSKTSTKGLPTNPSGLTGDVASVSGRGFLEKTIEFNVKPNTPTITQPQFYGTASSKPTVTVGNLPTNAQLQNGATVTVELYQGTTKVASKTVTDRNGSTTLSAGDFTANLTEGQQVYAVVKVSGGQGDTAYSDNSENRNVTGRSTLTNLASDKLIIQVQDLANNRRGTLSDAEKNTIKQAIFEANKNGVLRGKQVSDINISDTGLITALDKDNKIAELQINPNTGVVTRFAHIRDDYNITYTNNGKPADRSTDPGFEWSQDGKSLIYKFDATSGVALQTNEVLKTITATPKNSQGQPSLTTVTGNDKALGEANSNGFSRNTTTGYFSKNGVGVNVLDLINPTTYRGGGNIDNTGNKLVDINHGDVNGSNIIGTNLETGTTTITGANGSNSITLNNVVKGRNGNSLIEHKQLYLMPKYTDATLLTDRGTTATGNTNVINVYFVPVDPRKPEVSRPATSSLAATKDAITNAQNVATDTNGKISSDFLTSKVDVRDNYDSPDQAKAKLEMYVQKDGENTRTKVVENNRENTDAISTIVRNAEQGNGTSYYKVIAKTTDRSGNVSDEAVVGWFKVEEKGKPTVKLVQNNQDTTLSESTPEASVPKVTVYRGEKAEITVKASDNTGKLSSFTTSGLPSGVTETGATSSDSATDARPLSHTLSGKVANDTTLGDKVLTVVASDKTTPTNTTTVKFKLDVKAQNEKYTPTAGITPVAVNNIGSISNSDLEKIKNSVSVPNLSTEATQDGVTKAIKDNGRVTVKNGKNYVTVEVIYPDRSKDEVSVEVQQNTNIQKQPTIYVVKGETISNEELRKFVYLPNGAQKEELPSTATVTATLDTATKGSKTTNITVTFQGLNPVVVPVTYEVIQNFPVANKVYDFAGVSRGNGSTDYYVNQGLRSEMSWFVEKETVEGGQKVFKKVSSENNMNTQIASDITAGVGEYRYKLGAKFREGRFTNQAEEAARLSYSGEIVHTVYDVVANTTKVEATYGSTLTNSQAESAVMKATNSQNLPVGTTYEWVANASGAAATNLTVSTYGEETRYVKVTLPKTREAGPDSAAATQVNPYKVIEVKVKVNETVKPTVKLISDNGDVTLSESTPEASLPKVTVYRGENATITVKALDNTGKVQNFTITNLPTGLTPDNSNQASDNATNATPLTKTTTGKVDKTATVEVKVVTVTVSDKSNPANTTTVQFKVDVKEQKDKYTPTAGTTVKVGNIGTISQPDGEKIKNAVTVPALSEEATRDGVTKKLKDNGRVTAKNGKNYVTVEVVYPDGSKDEVDVAVDEVLKAGEKNPTNKAVDGQSYISNEKVINPNKEDAKFTATLTNGLTVGADGKVSGKPTGIKWTGNETEKIVKIPVTVTRTGETPVNVEISVVVQRDVTKTPTFTVGTQDPTTGNVEVTVNGVPEGTKVTLPGVSGERPVKDGKVVLTNNDLPTAATTGKGIAQEDGKLPKEGTSEITIPKKLVPTDTPTFTVGTQDPTTGNVEVTVNGVPEGTKVTLPGVSGERPVKDGKVVLTNNDLPTAATTGKGIAQEDGKLPKEGTSEITIPKKLVPTDTPTFTVGTQDPTTGNVEVTVNGVPEGTKVTLPGVSGERPVKDGKVVLTNNDLPTAATTGKGIAQEDGKLPKEGTSEITIPKKLVPTDTPTFTVGTQDPTTGNVEVTVNGVPEGTKVTLPGVSGERPVKDGKVVLTNNDLPTAATTGKGIAQEDGKLPKEGTSEITIPKKLVPTDTPTFTVGTQDPTTGNVEVTVNGVPEGTKVTLPGVSGERPVKDGKVVLTNNDLPTAATTGKGIAQEDGKLPKEGTSEITIPKKLVPTDTPTFTVGTQDPTTGNVEVTVNGVPEGTKVTLPGVSGERPVKDGKVVLTNNDLPTAATTGKGIAQEDGKLPKEGTSEITIPKKLVPTDTPTFTVGTQDPTTGNVEVTVNGVPEGTKVTLPGVSGERPVKDGKVVLTNNDLPTAATTGKGIAQEDGKLPKEGTSEITIPKKLVPTDTPTFTVGTQDPTTGNVEVTVNGVPEGTKVTLPGVSGERPVKDGKVVLTNNDLPTAATTGKGIAQEDGKLPKEGTSEITIPKKLVPTDTPTFTVGTQDPTTGNVEVTVNGVPEGTKVTLPGVSGERPVKDGKVVLTNNDLPTAATTGKGIAQEDGKLPKEGTSEITIPKKLVPTDTPTFTVGTQDPTTGNVEVTVNGVPEGTKVTLPGVSGERPVKDGKVVLTNNDLPTAATTGKGIAQEDGKLPKEGTSEITIPKKLVPTDTPTFTVGTQDPTTGNVEVTVNGVPEGTKVTLPGVSGERPVKDGKVVLTNNDLPTAATTGKGIAQEDGKLPKEGTSEITIPKKLVPTDTPTFTVGTQDPTTGNVEVTVNGVPEGTKVTLPGVSGERPVKDGKVVLTNNDLPTAATTGKGIAQEDGKLPKEGTSEITIPKKLVPTDTPTFTVGTQDPTTGNVEVTVNGVPEGTKVTLPGVSGERPVKDGKVVLTNNDLPTAATTGKGIAQEDGKLPKEGTSEITIPKKLVPTDTPTFTVGTQDPTTGNVEVTVNGVPEGTKVTLPGVSGERPVKDGKVVLTNNDLPTAATTGKGIAQEDGKLPKEGTSEITIPKKLVPTDTPTFTVGTQDPTTGNVEVTVNGVPEGTKVTLPGVSGERPVKDGKVVLTNNDLPTAATTGKGIAQEDGKLPKEGTSEITIPKKLVPTDTPTFTVGTQDPTTGNVEVTVNGVPEGTKVTLPGVSGERPVKDGKVVLTNNDLPTAATTGKGIAQEDGKLPKEGTSEITIPKKLVPTDTPTFTVGTQDPTTGNVEVTVNGVPEGTKVTLPGVSGERPVKDGKVVLTNNDLPTAATTGKGIAQEDGKLPKEGTSEITIPKKLVPTDTPTFTVGTQDPTTGNVEVTVNGVPEGTKVTLPGVSGERPVKDGKVVLTNNDLPTAATTGKGIAQEDGKLPKEGTSEITIPKKLVPTDTPTFTVGTQDPTTGNVEVTVNGVPEGTKVTLPGVSGERPVKDGKVVLTNNDLPTAATTGKGIAQEDGKLPKEGTSEITIPKKLVPTDTPTFTVGTQDPTTGNVEVTVNGVPEGTKVTLPGVSGERPVKDGKVVLTNNDLPTAATTGKGIAQEDGKLPKEGTSEITIPKKLVPTDTPTFTVGTQDPTTGNVEVTVNGVPEGTKVTLPGVSGERPVKDGKVVLTNNDLPTAATTGKGIAQEDGKLPKEGTSEITIPKKLVPTDTPTFTVGTQDPTTGNVEVTVNGVPEGTKVTLPGVSGERPVKDGKVVLTNNDLPTAATTGKGIAQEDGKLPKEGTSEITIPKKLVPTDTPTFTVGTQDPTTGNVEVTVNGVPEGTKVTLPGVSGERPVKDGKVVLTNNDLPTAATTGKGIAQEDGKLPKEGTSEITIPKKLVPTDTPTFTVGTQDPTTGNVEVTVNGVPEGTKVTLPGVSGERPVKDGKVVLTNNDLPTAATTGKGIAQEDGKLPKEGTSEITIPKKLVPTDTPTFTVGTQDPTTGNVEVTVNGVPEGTKVTLPGVSGERPVKDGKVVLTNNDLPTAATTGKGIAQEDGKLPKEGTSEITIPKKLVPTDTPTFTVGTQDPTTGNVEVTVNGVPEGTKVTLPGVSGERPVKDGKVVLTNNDLPTAATTGKGIAQEDGKLPKEGTSEITIPKKLVPTDTPTFTVGTQDPTTGNVEVTVNGVPEGTKVTLPGVSGERPVKDGKVVLTNNDLPTAATTGKGIAQEDGKLPKEGTSEITIPKKLVPTDTPTFTVGTQDPTTGNVEVTVNGVPEGTKVTLPGVSGERPVKDGKVVLTNNDLPTAATTGKGIAQEDGKLPKEGTSEITIPKKLVPTDTPTFTVGTQDPTTGNVEVTVNGVPEGTKVTLPGVSGERPVKDGKVVLTNNDLPTAATTGKGIAQEDGKLPKEGTSEITIPKKLVPTDTPTFTVGTQDPTTGNVEVTVNGVPEGTKVTLPGVSGERPVKDGKVVLTNNDLPTAATTGKGIAQEDGKLPKEGTSEITIPKKLVPTDTPTFTVGTQDPTTGNVEVTVNGVPEGTKVTLPGVSGERPVKDGKVVLTNNDLPTAATTGKGIAQEDGKLPKEGTSEITIPKKLVPTDTPTFTVGTQDPTTGNVEVTVNGVPEGTKVTLPGVSGERPVKDGKVVLTNNDLPTAATTGKGIAQEDGKLPKEGTSEITIPKKLVPTDTPTFTVGTQDPTTGNVEVTVNGVPEGTKVTLPGVSGERPVKDGKVVLTNNDLPTAATTGKGIAQEDGKLPKEGTSEITIPKKLVPTDTPTFTVGTQDPTTGNVEVTVNGVPEGTKVTLPGVSGERPVKDGKVVLTNNDLPTAATTGKGIAQEDGKLPKEGTSEITIPKKLVPTDTPTFTVGTQDPTTGNVEVTVNGVPEGTKVTLPGVSGERPVKDGKVVLTNNDLPTAATTGKGIAQEDGKLPKEGTSEITIPKKLVPTDTPTFTVGTQDPTTGNVEVTVNGVPEGTKVTLPGVSGERPVKDGKVVLTNNDLPTAATTGKGIAQEDGKLPKEGTSEITIPGKLTSAKGNPATEFEVTIPLPLVVSNPEDLTPDEKTELEKKVEKSNPNMDVKVDDKGNVTITDLKTGQSKVIPVKDLTVKDFEPVKPTNKVPVKDKAHLTPEEKKQVADKVKAKNPGKEVTVGDDGTATVTDPTTGISHTIPGTDLVNQDFEPVKPTEKVPVKDKSHLTPEEKKQVADKVKAKNPGKEVTVGDDGTAIVTDPTTGISHTIPATDLVIVFAKGDSTKLEVPGLIITKWIDEKGNDLKQPDVKAPSVSGEANEALEPGEIDGYVFVRTEVKGNIVTHIFRKVSSTETSGDNKPQSTPEVPTDNTEHKPETISPNEQTTETENPTAKPKASQNILPNTGTADGLGIFSTAVASILAGLGLFLPVKKEDEDEEETQSN